MSSPLGVLRVARRRLTSAQFGPVCALVIGCLELVPILFGASAVANTPLSLSSTHDPANLLVPGEHQRPLLTAQPASNGSTWNVWFSGLPPNVSASFVFGQFGPQGGWFASGEGGDGFDGGGGPVDAGTYVLYVQPAPGFIPVTASATYFVSAPEDLNLSVAFVPAQPCYQVFTEVGLPQGTSWWVVGAGGVAFFANNSVIDATGCGGLQGVAIGSSIGYQVVKYPPSAYYPSGAAIPVFFASPNPTAQFPVGAIAVIAVLVGSLLTVLYFVERRRRARGELDQQPPTTYDPTSSRRQ